MANRKLGKYEIIERLGRGGMAEVYRGYHVSLDRYVAIKVLHAFLADDPEFKSRFEREAQNVAKLRHSNIVQVYDFEYDEPSESFYMVMELIDGPTLKDRLTGLSERGERLPLTEAIRIVREAAGALSYAHSRGMIHRDVKPANLMLDHDNRVVLTDFGIAKIVTGAQFTASGGMVGTPAYMAPEQGLGEAGDERSDLYSLGVILFQLVTGQLPYDAETPLAIILKHLNAPIPSALAINPELPEAMERIVHKAIGKESQERYQSASDFIDDLARFERGETPEASQQGSLLQLSERDTAEVPRYSGTPSPISRDEAAQHDTLSGVRGQRSAETPPIANATASPRRFPWWGWGGILAGVVASVFLLGSAAGILGPIMGIATADQTATALAALVPTVPTDTPQPSDTPTDTLTPSDTPTNTATWTPSATLTPSDTPTVTNTPTPSDTPTPTFTLSPTPATPIAQPPQNIVMRLGPDQRYPQVATLNGGESVAVVGVSADNLWYVVRNSSDQRGWVRASQINIFGSVRGLPVVPSPTNTPTYTPTITSTPSVTPTPSPTATPSPNLTETALARTAAVIAATETTAACRFDYEIVEQDPPDGDFVPVNTEYRRTIKLLNSGTCAWEPNTGFYYLDGESFTAPPQLFIRERVEPGAEYDLVFRGKTPSRGGGDVPLSGRWQLRTPGQILIGDPIVISLRVYG